MMPRTKREHLRQLVEGKNQWSRPLTEEEKALGFLGWHERGYLPHCDFPGLIQFVTFRLADSMPSSRRAEWEHLLAIDDVREKRTKLESYLDRGHGCCNLRESGTAQLVEQTLLYFHEKRCEVVAWCVMPNHVHVLVHIWQTPLWKLVRSWKRHVAITDGPKALERRSPTRREPVDWLGRRPALRHRCYRLYSFALSTSVRETFFAGTFSLSNAISLAPDISGSGTCPPSETER